MSCDEAVPSKEKSLKRGAEDAIEAQEEKRLKLRRRMDWKTCCQCITILNILSSHENGWIFKQPVDPVSLKIPDYLTIKSHPMDFGKIKYKLEANNYPCIEDFVADVRLVFSNSVTCNAPGNEVHAIAKELSQIFESKWEEFERNWKCEQDNLSGKSPRRFARLRFTPNYATYRLIPRGMNKGSGGGAEEESKKEEIACIALEKMKINADKTDKSLKDFKELVDEDNRSGMEIECPLEKHSFFNKDYKNVADNKDLKGRDDS